MEENAASKSKIGYVKAVAALLLAAYFFWTAFRPVDFRFIDYVNLIFHEAGHVIFAFFGNFMSIAGGTIMQLAIPALCAMYFYTHGQRYSAGLVLFWLGESFVNVSIYAADARLMLLPLLGGDSVIHDWNEMLTITNLLPYAEAISSSIRLLGVLTMICALCLSLRYSFKKEVGNHLMDF